MKTALVTGGSKGIGFYTVLRLIELGYRVITCSRREEAWSEAVSNYPQLSSVDYQCLDLSQEPQLERLFTYIDSAYGSLDVAVNNASPALASGGRYQEVESSRLKDTLTADFWSHALCLKHELNLMKTGGAIVNVSSINGLRATPNAAMYGAAKHAVEGLTRSLALESIDSGIRINAVAPGVTWTPRWQAKEQDSPNIRNDVSDVVPIKRFAQVEEVVDAIEFLLSDKASYIVGHTLVVDGGLSLTWG